MRKRGGFGPLGKRGNVSDKLVSKIKCTCHDELRDVEDVLKVVICKDSTPAVVFHDGAVAFKVKFSRGDIPV